MPLSARAQVLPVLGCLAHSLCAADLTRAGSGAAGLCPGQRTSPRAHFCCSTVRPSPGPSLSPPSLSPLQVSCSLSPLCHITAFSGVEDSFGDPGPDSASVPWHKIGQIRGGTAPVLVSSLRNCVLDALCGFPGQAGCTETGDEVMALFLEKPCPVHPSPPLQGAGCDLVLAESAAGVTWVSLA